MTTYQITKSTYNGIIHETSNFVDANEFALEASRQHENRNAVVYVLYAGRALKVYADGKRYAA